MQNSPGTQPTSRRTAASRATLQGEGTTRSFPTRRPTSISRYARNPRIVGVRSDLGIARELGEGIERIFTEMRLARPDRPDRLPTPGISWSGPVVGRRTRPRRARQFDDDGPTDSRHTPFGGPAPEHRADRRLGEHRPVHRIAKSADAAHTRTGRVGRARAPRSTRVLDTALTDCTISCNADVPGDDAVDRLP